MEFVFIFIVLAIGALIMAFVLGLSSKAEAKAAEKEEAKEEKLKELQGWYTAEMREDYEKAEAERAKQEAIRDERLLNGLTEAIDYLNEYRNARNILFYAFDSEKITLAELKASLERVYTDLNKKYPDVMYFVIPFCKEKDPLHKCATRVFEKHYKVFIDTYGWMQHSRDYSSLFNLISGDIFYNKKEN